MASIPVIDVSEYMKPSADHIQAEKDAKRIASEIDQAFMTVGFFYLAGHTVCLELMAQFYQACMDFFLITSHNEKMAAAQPETFDGKYAAQGYTPIGNESVAQSKNIKTAHDILESFCFRRGAQEPKQDVDKLPKEMVRLAQEYWKQVRALDTKLMELCAIALGLNANYFAGYNTKDNAIIKCAYYPKPKEDECANPRYGAHTDYMFLTLLFADPYYKSICGGLEVWDTQNSKWISCPQIKNTLIVNMGDLLQRLTNDRWIANLHQVAPAGLNESVTERLSIVYFNSPDDDSIVHSISTKGEPIKYPPIKASDFFQQKLASGTTLRK